MTSLKRKLQSKMFRNRCRAFLLALVMVLSSRIDLLTQAFSSEFHSDVHIITVEVTEILAALERYELTDSPQVEEYGVDTLYPGDGLLSYTDDPLTKWAHARYNLDPQIIEALERLTLPMNSNLLLQQIADALEGTRLVGFWNQQEAHGSGCQSCQIIVAVDPASYELVVIGINPEHEEHTFHLTLLDENGEPVELSDVRTILMQAEEQLLDQDELALLHSDPNMEIELVSLEELHADDIAIAPEESFPEEEPIVLPEEKEESADEQADNPGGHEDDSDNPADNGNASDTPPEEDHSGEDLNATEEDFAVEEADNGGTTDADRSEDAQESGTNWGSGEDSSFENNGGDDSPSNTSDSVDSGSDDSNSSSDASSSGSDSDSGDDGGDYASIGVTQSAGDLEVELEESEEPEDQPMLNGDDVDTPDEDASVRELENLRQSEKSQGSEEYGESILFPSLPENPLYEGPGAEDADGYIVDVIVISTEEQEVQDSEVMDKLESVIPAGGVVMLSGTMGFASPTAYGDIPAPPNTGPDIRDIFYLMGSAHVNSTYHNVAIVTPDVGGQKGYMWAKEQLDLTRPFSTEMYLYLYKQYGIGTVADGMTFTMHADSRGLSAQGTHGAGLGVYGTDYIKNALTVEFDTYYNPDTNHPSTDPTSSAHVALTRPAAEVRAAGHYDYTQYMTFTPQARWYLFTMEWTPNGVYGGTLQYSFDGQSRTFYIGDVWQWFGGTRVYWGFTGSTGQYSALQAAAFVSLPTQQKLDVQKQAADENGVNLDGGAVRTGDTITYTVKATSQNTPNMPEAVVITDTLPPYLEYVPGSAEMVTRDNSTPVPIAPSNYDPAVNTLVFLTNVRLDEADEWLAVSFKAKVKEEAYGQTLHNTATVLVPGNDEVTTNTTETKVYADYTVKHHYQNPDKNGYEYDSDMDEVREAFSGTEITYTPRLKTGFSFSRTEGPSTVGTVPSANVLNVYYNRNGLTLTFDQNNSDAESGAPEPISKTVTYGAQAGLLPGVNGETGAPTRPGHTFLGWSTTPGDANTVDFTPGTVVTENTTVYAVWKDVQGAVSLNKTVVHGSVKPTDRFGFKLYDAGEKELSLSGLAFIFSGSGEVVGDTFYLHHDESVTITGLAMNEQYYLQEVAYDTANYDFVSLGGSATNKLLIQPTTKEPVAVTAVNRAKFRSEWLNVYKALPDSADMPDEVFTITLSGPNGQSYQGTIQSDNAPGVVSLTDMPDLLPYGTYTVSEADNINFELESILVAVNGVIAGTTFDIDESTYSVAIIITNKAKRTGASAKEVLVEKKITNDPTDKTGLFTVTFTSPGGEEIKVENLAANGEAVPVTGLRYGVTYTVTEADTENYTLAGIQVNGRTVSQVTYDATAPAQQKVVVSNKRSAIPVDLTAIKSITTRTELTGDFTIALTHSEYTDTATVTGGAYGRDNLFVFTNYQQGNSLPLGYYKVEETSLDSYFQRYPFLDYDSNVRVAVTNSANETTVSYGGFTIYGDTESVELRVQNKIQTVELDDTSFTAEKGITLSGLADESFGLKVEGVGHDASFTATRAAGAQYFTFDGNGFTVPVGDYKVTETFEEDTSFRSKSIVVHVTGSGDNATITDDGGFHVSPDTTKIEIVVTNDPKTFGAAGVLDIQKLVNGSDKGDESVLQESFTLNLRNTGNPDYAFVGTVDSRTGEINWEPKLEGALPYGVYKITEQENSGSNFSMNGITVTVDGKAVGNPFVVDASTGKVQVVVRNNSKKTDPNPENPDNGDGSNVRVKKLVAGDNPLNEPFKIQLRPVGGGDSITVSVSAGGTSPAIKGLVYGKQYQVIEEIPPYFSNSPTIEVKVGDNDAVSSPTFVVTEKDKEILITVTNIPRDIDGSKIAVEKHVNGTKEGGKHLLPEQFKIELLNSAGTAVATGRADSVSGTIEWDEEIPGNLPYGWYSVRETLEKGGSSNFTMGDIQVYLNESTTPITNSTFLIDETTQTVVIRVHNHSKKTDPNPEDPEKGDGSKVLVYKDISGEVRDLEELFTINLVPADGEGKDIQGADAGTITVSLKAHGQSGPIKDLVYGQRYRVEEVKPDGEYYTNSPTISIEGGAYTNGDTFIVTEEDKNISITVTNHVGGLSVNENNLKIQKLINGSQTGGANYAKEEFSLTLSQVALPENRVVSTGTVNSQDGSINWDPVLTNLTLDYGTYLIEESFDLGANSYFYLEGITVTGAKNADGGRFSIDDEVKTIGITVRNRTKTVELDAASITAEKIINRSGLEDESFGLKVEGVDHNASFTATRDKGAQYFAFDGNGLTVPVGSYQVTETFEQGTSFRNESIVVHVTGSGNNVTTTEDGRFHVSPGTTKIEIVVTNGPKTFGAGGVLDIQKLVNGSDKGDESVLQESFTLNLQNTGNPDYAFVGTVDSHTGEINWEPKLEGALPYGVYKITEQENSGSNFSMDGITVTIGGKAAENPFVVDASTGKVQVVVSNRSKWTNPKEHENPDEPNPNPGPEPEPDNSRVTVRKVVDGENLYPDTTFTVQLVPLQEGGKTIELTVKDGQTTKPIRGIVYGLPYQVKEVDIPPYFPNSPTISITGGSYTDGDTFIVTEEDKNISITVTNHVGGLSVNENNLKIQKLINGSQTGGANYEKEEFSLTLSQVALPENRVVSTGTVNSQDGSINWDPVLTNLTLDYGTYLIEESFGLGANSYFYLEGITVTGAKNADGGRFSIDDEVKTIGITVSNRTKIVELDAASITAEKIINRSGLEDEAFGLKVEGVGHNASFTATRDKGAQYFTFDGNGLTVPVGDYKVTETFEQGTSFRNESIVVHVTGSGNNVTTTEDGRFHVSPGTTKIEIVVTNGPKTFGAGGVLDIQKLVNGSDKGDESVLQESFTLNLQNTGNPDYAFVGTVDSRTGEINWEPKLEGALPYGVYKIAEQENSGSNFSMDGITVTVGGKAAGNPFVVDASTGKVQVVVSNRSKWTNPKEPENPDEPNPNPGPEPEPDNSRVTVRKVVDGENLYPDTTFTVQLVPLQADGKTPLKDGKTIELTVKDGQITKPIRGIVYGLPYQVKEVDIPPYFPNSPTISITGGIYTDGDTFIVTEEDKNISITVTNRVNSFQRANILGITKLVAGEVLGGADMEQEFFQLHLYHDKEQLHYTATVNSQNCLDMNWEPELPDQLPYGTYRISEELSNDSSFVKDGIEVTLNAGTNSTVLSGDEVVFQVTDQTDSVSITVNNRYRTTGGQDGKVSLQKTVLRPNPDSETEFTVTLTPQGDNIQNPSAYTKKLNIKDGQTIDKIDGLLYGVTYLIEEPAELLDERYDPAAIEIKVDGTDTDTFNLLPSQDEVTILVANGARRTSGTETEVQLNKIIVNDTADKESTFDVVFSESGGSGRDPITVTVTANSDSVAVPGLIYGIPYTISEIPVSGYSWTGSIVNDSADTYQITPGKDGQTVTITNRMLARDDIQVTAIKTIIGETMESGTFSLVIAGVDENFTRTGIAENVSYGTDLPFRFDGDFATIPTGRYTITETTDSRFEPVNYAGQTSHVKVVVTDVDGQETISYGGFTVNKNTKAISATVQSRIRTAQITNDFAARKDIKLNGLPDETFLLTLTDAKDNTVATGTRQAGEERFVFDPLPTALEVGAYSVVETLNETSNFRNTAIHITTITGGVENATTDGTFRVEPDTTGVEIIIVNEPGTFRGGEVLETVKHIEGSPDGGRDVVQEYFPLRLTNDLGNVYTALANSQDGREVFWEPAFGQIPYGRYTLSEDLNDSASNFRLEDIQVYLNGSDEPFSTDGTFVVDRTTASVRIVVNNSYKRTEPPVDPSVDPGDGSNVSARKTILGDTLLTDSEFTILLVPQGSFVEDETIRLTLKGGEVQEHIGGIIYGVNYQVVETDIPDVFDPQYSVAVDGRSTDTLVLTEGPHKTRSVVVTNKGDTSGVLIIQKLLEDDSVLIHDSDTFTFSLTSNGDEVKVRQINNGIYIVDETGSDRITVTDLSNRNAVEIRGLEIGRRYEVREQLGDDSSYAFSRIAMPTNAQVQEDGSAIFSFASRSESAHIPFINKNKITGEGDGGNVTIRKDVRNTRHTSKEFTILLTDQLGSVKQFTLGSDETTEHITGLIYGMEYTVSEIDLPEHYVLEHIRANGSETDRFTITEANKEVQVVVTNKYHYIRPSDYTGSDRRDEYKAVTSHLIPTTIESEPSPLTTIIDALIPEAGGFPVELVGIAGAAVLGVGMILKRRRKKQ